MAESRLHAILSDVRRRLLGISLGSGLAWALVAAILLLVLCAWADLALDLPATLRFACLMGALLLAAALVSWTAYSALRQGRGTALARRLDSVGGTGGQILAGVDLARQYRVSAAAVAHAPTMTAQLAQIAVERAARLAGDIRSGAAVPLKPLYYSLGVVGAVALVLGIFAAAAPRLAATQWLRFTDPFGDHPPYSSIVFDVQPGDTQVLYGTALDVRVKASGGVVEQVDLVLLKSDATSADAASEEAVLPMFPEPGGSWRATVAEMTQPGRYLVRTRGARSRQYTYNVITVPEIREVRFRVTPPAYTRKPPYDGPLPQGGISALPGTTVEAWLKSNRPLSGGIGQFIPASTSGDAAPSAVALAPVAAGASEVHATMTVDRAGKLELGVTDVAGQPSRQTFTAPIHLLQDDRPFVRMMEPRAQSYATPDVTLNVQVLAEDDYGVSRVQVFRSLNDSRPRPVDVPIPTGQPRRVPAAVALPLGEYGLKPGDVIRLFARVEDTDPAGAKGSESSIVTVQIISKEELNRMTMARQGLETLQSKYEQARRRLEALDNEIRKQQEELEKVPADSELAKEAQQKLEELAKQVVETADDIARIAGEDLPLDIDRKLRQSLYDMAADVRQSGERFDHAAAQLGLTSAAAKKAIDQLRKELGLQREEYEKEAMEPLEHLAKIFPLKEDEARFADLARRQRDLADRMQSLQGPAGDDPKLKSRLRDLEQEQRQLREELRDLLQDIDDHVAALPDDPKLQDLKDAAAKFAQDVRASEAAQQMNDSETRLSEFEGGKAAEQAKAAADTLESFLARCQGMGNQASQCLGFQPTLSESLGNTIEQLLEMEGLGTGPNGAGGAGGGYSARRSTLRNVGLYGSLPTMSQSSKSKGGMGESGGGARSDGNPDAGEPGDTSDVGRNQASGAADTAVPPRYKRKVGEYFQRVADELGE